MITPHRDEYQIERYPGGFQGTLSTVDLIKQLLVEGTRSYPIRARACEIVGFVPSRDSTGEIKAVYNWIRSRAPFRMDPHGLELLHTPERTLEEIDATRSYGVDCDDMVILAGALLQSIGHPVRFVLAGHGPGLYNHIFLESYSNRDLDWIALDLAMPDQPAGWSPRAGHFQVIELDAHDLIPGPWPETTEGEMQPEDLGKVPADYDNGSVVVMPDGGAWVREGKLGPAGYWRLVRRVHTPTSLGQVRALDPGRVERLPELDPVTWAGADREYGLKPHQIQQLIRTYANEPQEIFIILTQPDANPARLRRLFGFKRPPEVRLQARRELDKQRKKQDALPKSAQRRMGIDTIKVPRSGHVDGNTAGTLYEAYAEFRAVAEAPELPADPAGEEDYGPSWADIVPDPDEFFGDSLWNDIAAAEAMANVTLQDLLDLYFMMTGKEMSTDLLPSSLAAEASDIFIPMQVIQQISAGFGMENLGQGWAEAIIGILMAVAAAAAALGSQIEDWIKAGRDIQETVAGMLPAGMDQAPDIVEDGIKVIEETGNLKDAIDGARDDAAQTGQDFMEDLRDKQEQTIQLALVRDNLNRLYRAVRRYGFDSEQAASFRGAVASTVEMGGMFFVLAKERSVRDLRQIKIMALRGDVQAEATWPELQAEMLRAGPIIYAWATEYAALPWDLDHVNIPGIPDPTPPGELPAGNFPWTDADQDKDEMDLDDIIGEKFDEETSGDSTGYGYWSNADDEMGWDGPSDDDTGREGGPRVEFERGAEGTWQDALDDAVDDAIAAGKRKKAEEEKSWIARHPILTVAGVASVSVGGWYGYKYLKQRYGK